MARRGDGLLSHELHPGEKSPQDACGVFGVWAPGEEVAKLCFYGLYALQHRGQESAGIASSNGERIRGFKDMGLVSQVFNEQDLLSLSGNLAIGHTRYSTTGSSTWANAQPIIKSTRDYTIALAHNGNLTNTGELAKELSNMNSGSGKVDHANSDSEIIAALLTREGTMNVEDSVFEILPMLEGAFSLVFMDETTLYAARDRNGVRPLVIGKLEAGWVVASETAALDIVGASFVREVEPGEFISINEDGFKSKRWAVADPKGCIFEYVYLARPDTSIAKVGVHKTRVAIGRQLAREFPADADLVIPVPESGTPAAIGYARESGIPYGSGLVKNAYVGRTFIQPSQTIRQLGLRLKLNPLIDVVAGKRIVVVDDSIVRGNTQRAIIKMLKEAGALEIHVRISSPPVKWPCFYGIDFATKAELIGAGLEIEEIRTSIGADSLGYVSLQGLINATTIEEGELCTACFTGKYPIRIPSSLDHEKQLLPLIEND
jgi:amidophosphoribosyltransferase